MVEHLLGLLKVKVIKGVNLAVRDISSSDPYVILRMGNKKLKTKVIKKNTNPVWNEELTLSIEDPNIPISVNVYDKDLFSRDDSMGHAEFDIRTFIEVVKRDLSNVPNGTVIQKITPSCQNSLAEESAIYKAEGTIMQDMALRLKDVECGEIELRLTWGTIPGARGLERF
ncbi:putative ADP-ribosylation factor GTPase-activating protein AGD11 isoform X1 [Carex littledalei]|uniref:Putative ADP-ribosylation factor GTPase-activating protein AGD11 isoform X1 n=1 Tax=Carex littledalei TaxID=544730 RepID=A0A833RAE8_9POAL|nr:putative ADP-ribosylation factor GTPase-activating protein AGD11 isoform X1 [Carex littledalei]